MSLVTTTVERGVATLTLDSPGNRNALSRALRADLLAAVRAAADDDAVRVVVLTHTGPVFCAGMDLKEEATAAPGEEGVRALPEVFEAVATLPKPTVARLAGAARAGGLGLVAACDLAVCVDTATFAFSEVRLGLVAASISALVLPRMDPRAAHELLLTGAVFGAARAREAGLVDRAVPAEQLDDVVTGLVGDLVLGEPGALAATKALLAQRRSPRLREELQTLAAASAERFASDAAREGMRAFASKRAPRWVPARNVPAQ